jgi:hypothetical protein
MKLLLGASLFVFGCAADAQTSAIHLQSSERITSLLETLQIRRVQQLAAGGDWAQSTERRPRFVEEISCRSRFMWTTGIGSAGGPVDFRQFLRNGNEITRRLGIVNDLHARISFEWTRLARIGNKRISAPRR